MRRPARPCALLRPDELSRLPQVNIADEPENADHNQVYRNDIVQHPRHHKNQNTGEQGYQRGKTQ